MNTNYDLNLTPKTMNQNKYIEAMMEFSTPMSSVSDRWMNDRARADFKKDNDYNSFDDQVDSTIVNNKSIDTTNLNHEVTKIDMIEKILQKLNEHKLNFNNTQYYMSILDNRIRQIRIVINQLQSLLHHNSSLKTTIDQLESRFSQISAKQEQIRAVTNSFYPSPACSHTDNDTIAQISPTLSIVQQQSGYVNHCIELIIAAKMNLNQQATVIEHLEHEKYRIRHQTDRFCSVANQRQELLIRKFEKIIQQQKENENHIEVITMNKPQFNYHHHHRQQIEFSKLEEEYHILQNENRALKYQIKNNIQQLSNFINQISL